MHAIRLTLVVILLATVPAAAQSMKPLEPLRGTLAPPLLGPPKMNAYGPGLHSDGTGRPFRYETNDGEALEGWNRVKPNGYGLGVDMDEYGRPVHAEPWP